MTCLEWLPNRRNKRAAADAFVASDERESFRPRGSSDDPIDGIFRIIFGELGSECRDLCRDGPNLHPGFRQDTLHRAFDRAQRTNCPARKKQGKLPDRDVRDRQPIACAGSAYC